MTQDIVIPPALRARALTLGGELAWPPKIAREVISYLRERSIAVLGVEVWMPEGSVPRIVHWSSYELDPTLKWESYVQEAADHALAEITSALPTGAVINLTWAERE